MMQHLLRIDISRKLTLTWKFKKMDGFTEKKWFVYIRDHHEGPHSLEEIQEKVTQGEVSPENYVWANGMTDWQIMKDIPEFHPFLGRIDPATLYPKPSSSLSQAPPVEAPAESEHTTPPPDDPSLNKPNPPEKSRWKTRPRWTNWVLAFLFPILFLGCYLRGYLDPLLRIPAFGIAQTKISEFSRPYLLMLTEHFPALGELVSPLPWLEDVSPDDYEELKSAARGKPSKVGPRFAVALAKSDPLSASFYVSSNLADGTQLSVSIVGISDTLLNQLSFGTQADVTLSKNLSKTSNLQFPDGKPIPRGEYIVYVSASEVQPTETAALLNSFHQTAMSKIPSEIPKNDKPLVFKTYFLGGTKDATYLSRLKDFHDKLHIKGVSEISEIKQFTATLESQLNSTLTKFSLVRKAKGTTRQQKAWEEFHREWMKLQGQLDQIFQKWSPEVIQNEFFLGTLYKYTQSAGHSIEKVHGFQHSYFTGVHDIKSLGIQLGEAISSAQSAMATLKTKINQAENLPRTPNGMPQREGL